MIVEIWQQVNTTARTVTSGYQSQDEFNRDINTVQNRIANILCDNYAKDQKIADALINHMMSATSTTSSIGVIPKPNDFFRIFAIWLNANSTRYPMNKIEANEIAPYSTSYIRKPDLATNSAGYYYLNGTIQGMPETQMNVTIVYCKKPVDASITLTADSSADSDYVVPTIGVELQWPQMLFNLFVYMMLEMLGIEQKEQILYEYSQLGIPKEAYVGYTIKEGVTS